MDDDCRIVCLHAPISAETINRLVDDLLADIRNCDMLDLNVSGKARLWAEYSIATTEELIVARDNKGFLLFVGGVSFNDPYYVGRYVWMLGCNKVYQYKKSLLYKFCKNKCREWVSKYQLLVNSVHCENTTSIKWLKRVCGAKFLDDVTTINGVDFKKFFITTGGV